MITHFLFFPFNLFTTTITFTFFFIFFLSNPFCAYAYRYNECLSPQPCGNVSHIGYPFWGNTWPWYCGGIAFQLHCPDSNHYPVLQIKQSVPYDHDLFFYVLDISNIRINNSNINKTYITIKLLHKSSSSGCPFFFTKNVVFESYLNYNSNVSVTRLYNDCHNNKTPPSNFVTCFDIDNQNHRYSYSPDGKGYEGCNYIEVPMLKQELNKLQLKKEALVDVLKKGFEVDFNYSLCSKCEESGGVCGSSEHQLFACYCKDNSQPQSEVCLKSEILKPNLALGREKRKLKLIFGIAGLVGLCVIALNVFLCCHMKKIKFWISSLLCKTRCYHTMLDLSRGYSASQFAIFSKRKGTQHQNIEAFLKIYGSLAPKRYTYANIRKWTNNFKHKLGEGGYGTVYKGRLPDGRLVAVKLLNQAKGNGEDFINEVASISRTNHVNIVALLGFCFEGSKRSLIYAFMSNGSLERFTYRGTSYMSLSWESMFDIAVGIAKGLDYLHRGCNARILHFDIKPHNILLDDEFHPKISDFGLSRLCPQQESTISMLEARGTIGYIAPEVFCRNFGGVSHKSDVYSYGMMILDLVCGRTNTYDVQHSSEMCFPEWIYRRVELGEEDILPVTLNEQEKELQRKMILVSLWCIQTYPSNRPSMSSIIEMMNGCLESIQMPPKPYISSPPRLVAYTSETSTVV